MNEYVLGTEVNKFSELEHTFLLKSKIEDILKGVDRYQGVFAKSSACLTTLKKKDFIYKV